MLYTFELYDLFDGFLGNREIVASDENEATEKLESALSDDGETLAQTCAEIEAQQSWEDEEFMAELDSQMSLGDLEQAAWNAYQAGVCPCGDAECGGIAWMLNSDDPFEF